MSIKYKQTNPTSNENHNLIKFRAHRIMSVQFSKKPNYKVMCPPLFERD